MKSLIISLFITFCLGFFATVSLGYGNQSFEFTDSLVIERLKEDIEILASEEMEGREAGTRGERKAAAFIKERMQQIGLQPVFKDSYLQEFEFFKGYEYCESSFLKICNQKFIIGKDVFILPHSADAKVKANGLYVGSGLQIPELVDDFAELEEIEGKIFFIEYYSHPESESEIDYDIEALVRMKIQTAEKKGAKGVIFVNSHGIYDDPVISRSVNVPRADIPVIFAKSDVYEFFEQQELFSKISLSASLLEKSYSAINVAGYIDNDAEFTVVIGGHYDHLGFGGPTSRDLQDSVLHFGADDNASGTAGVIETARYFSSGILDKYNYLFVAFSAEEKGLLGSRYFTESDAYDMDKINFMFNFDMIGRMQNNRLILIGTGTSPLWDTIIKSSKPEHFNITKVKTGIGGSDHSSFYLQNIPVIFFHTGPHEDYHASTDTPDKINYEGAYDIINFSIDMIEFSTQFEKLEFSETPITQTRRREEDGVSLGLMPDHAFEGKGLRIMAIVDDRPAQKAGLKAGDIILGINDDAVKEIHSYMRILGELEKGDKISVLIKRDEKKLIIELKL